MVTIVQCLFSFCTLRVASSTISPPCFPALTKRSLNYFPLPLFSFFITFSSIFVFISLLFLSYTPCCPLNWSIPPLLYLLLLHHTSSHCAVPFTLSLHCSATQTFTQFPNHATHLMKIKQQNSRSRVVHLFGSCLEMGGVVARLSAGGRDPPLL